MVQHRFRIACTAGLVAVALLAGACSSSSKSNSSSQTPTEKWASEICTAGSTWVTQVKGLTNQLSSVRSTDQLTAIIDSFTKDTKKLVDDLSNVGPPNTQAGQEAKKTLDSLQKELETQQQAIDKTLSSDSSGISGALTKASQLAAEVATAVTATTTAYNTLQSIDKTGEIGKAFQTVPACTALKDSLSTSSSSS